MPPSGSVGVVRDRYRAEVPVSSASSASSAFERIRDRLFAYDIFPPWLFQHVACPPYAISEGMTIVQRVVVGSFGLEMAVRVVAVWDREDGAPSAMPDSATPPSRGTLNAVSRPFASDSMQTYA